MHWFKSLLLNSTLLRKSFFPLLKKIDFKVIVKQYLMNHPLYLKLWGHKGYWFYRADRESEEMIPFSKLISKYRNIMPCSGGADFASSESIDVGNLKK